MSIISKYGLDLYKILISIGFVPGTARLITAQAAHETGNFTSDIFKYNNNPFGMKLPEIRETTAIGKARGHAVFDSIASACDDYYLYYYSQKYPLIWTGPDEFVTALKDHKYFEGPLDSYKKAVRKFHSLYFYV